MLKISLFLRNTSLSTYKRNYMIPEFSLKIRLVDVGKNVEGRNMDERIAIYCSLLKLNIGLIRLLTLFFIYSNL